MKKKLITLIAAMLALPVFAALQMVDITTLTTNTVIHLVSPGILFTNFSTNAYTRYTTTDTNALQIGDTPFQAFTKVNANTASISNSIAVLNGFTNSTGGISATTVTNIANGVYSNNPSSYVTASIANGLGGGSGTTNFTLTGFVKGWTTNNQLSTAGTNTVNLLVTNALNRNYVLSQNGFSSNQTIVSAISIAGTNAEIDVNNTTTNTFGGSLD